MARLTFATPVANLNWNWKIDKINIYIFTYKCLINITFIMFICKYVHICLQELHIYYLKLLKLYMFGLVLLVYRCIYRNL